MNKQHVLAGKKKGTFSVLIEEAYADPLSQSMSEVIRWLYLCEITCIRQGITAIIEATENEIAVFWLNYFTERDLGPMLTEISEYFVHFWSQVSTGCHL